MKNTTTKFGPTGNSFLYYCSDNPKYKNVKLVPVSDAGYQAYCLAKITSSRSNHPVDYTPKPVTALWQASKIVEHLVRKWHGSISNRIIQYDVFYRGSYHRQYKECDIVRLENDGSVTVG